MPLSSAPTRTPFEAFFDLSPTAALLYAPVYDAAEQLLDFTFFRLNPAAQQLLGLPAQPVGTYRQQFSPPAGQESFAQHAHAFLGDSPAEWEEHYPLDGHPSAYHVLGQRTGDYLLVYYTPRPAVLPAEAPVARESAGLDQEHRVLQALIAQAPVAIGLFQGEDIRVTAANTRLAAMWGYRPEQVLGRPLVEGVPELQGQGFEELLRQVLTTQVPVTGTEVPATMRRDGQLQTTYYNFVYQPLYDQLGQVVGVIDVAVEVTEQVQARQQLEQLNRELETRVVERTQQLLEQQLLLGQILSQVPAAVATLQGPEHRFAFFNEQYQIIVAERAQLGSPLAEVVPEVVEQGFVAILDTVYTTGQPFVQAAVPAQLYDPHTASLVTHYMDLNYQPLLDGQGTITGILAFVLNVTDAVRARQRNDVLQADFLAAARLQAQQRQDLLHLFEQAPVAVALLREPDHRLDYVNPLFTQLYPGAQLGRTMTESYTTPAMQALIQQLDQVYQSGTLYQATAVPLRAAGQAGRYVSLVAQAYREHGRIAGVALFVQEVTEQVVARQQVQQLNEELAAMNEELAAINEELHASNEQLQDTNTHLLRTNTDLDTFVYTASHDLKAPIANIEGLLLALHHNLPTAVAQEALIARLLLLMQGAVGRFQQTIGHLTNIAQLQQLESTETVNLPALVADVRLDLAPLLEVSAATLTVSLRECEAVRAAPKTLRSVVYNLLSNALKYRAPDRAAQVQLQARCTPGQLVLTVQDNGLGLDAQQQARLFGMFRRLHTHGEGSGVGLFMVKRLVENVGGTITVQSAPGVGSTFTVSLPL